MSSGRQFGQLLALTLPELLPALYAQGRGHHHIGYYLLRQPTLIISGAAGTSCLLTLVT